MDLHRRELQNLPIGMRVADARSVSLDWHHGGDEQVQFPPFPGDRYPYSGHALPDLRRTVAYRPGSLNEVLTGHYRRAHPEALGLPSR